MRHYPDNTIRWIGLQLLAPGSPGTWPWPKIIDAFSEYVKLNQGTAIMLGVVEENQAAYRFLA